MTTSFRLDEREQAKNVAAYLAQLERRIQDLERSNSLTNASVDGGAIEVFDEDGSLQVVVGEQGDGTTGVIHVNGPPPPTPTTPVVAEARGGVAATWDGLFIDALSAPLDFSRIEVHASTVSVFEPTQTTQVGTIESPRGGVFLIPTEVPVHVRFLARTLSGTGGEPSATAGPVGPGQVVAQDVLDGIINENKLTAQAVTAAKLALGAVNNVHLAAKSVTADKLVALSVTAEKIAAFAITTDKLAVLSVTADKIAVNSIDASHIRAGVIDATHVRAGSITADRLTIVSSPNMLSDPSFEGPAAAALVAGQTYWTIANDGNGSAKAALLNCVASTPVIRTLTLAATFPILSFQQLHLAVDVKPSTDWVGASVRVYARWIDHAGVVTFEHVTKTNPTRGLWTGLSGVVTAPAGTVQAEIRLAAYDVTAGSVAFDNAVIQPVMGKVQIADGAITAVKLDADAINGKVITGATVRTAASGPRLVLDSSRLTAYGRGSQRIILDPNADSPFLSFGSDDGSNLAYLQAVGTGSDLSLYTYAGRAVEAGKSYRWRSVHGDQSWIAECVVEGSTATPNWVGGRVYLTRTNAWLQANGAAVNLGDAQATIISPTIRANGVFRADNIAMGTVKVRPTPGVPTPVTLSGGNIKGSKFRAQLTANTGYPGTRVTGVSFTGLSSEGMTIWVTRTDGDETTIHWQIIGED